MHRALYSGWRRRFPEDKPFNDLSCDEMRLDNFLDIVFIDCGVPDALRVDHDHRTERAPIQTPRLVDPYRPLSAQAKCLDPALGILLQGFRTLASAALPALWALVQAEENVVLVKVARLHAGAFLWTAVGGRWAAGGMSVGVRGADDAV